MTKRIHILSMMLCLHICCMADNLVILSDFSYHHYTTHDGLPQMQTETIWQDSKGYIYIGTLSGFVRYDGKTLEPFLKGKRINIVGFAETEEGVTAFGFRRKWLLNGNRITMSTMSEDGMLYNNFNSPNLPPDMVLIEDAEEQNRRVCRFTEQGMKELFSNTVLDKMMPDRKMCIDNDSYYIPTEEGLYVCKQSSLSKISEKKDIFSLIRHQSKLYAFAADGVYIVNNDSLEMSVPFEFSDPAYGLSVCTDHNNHIFISDSHTLYLFNGQSVRRLSGGFNMIKDIFTDKWGRLWMATYQGAYLFYNTNFEVHRLADTNDIVRSICQDKDGHLVMGTLNGKVIVDGKIMSDIPGNYYSPNAVELAGKVYMPGNGDIMCVEGGQCKWLGLPTDKYQFVANFENKLLIGTRRALLTFAPQNSRIDTLTTEIPHSWCASTDGKGNLWVGSTYGLYEISKDSKSETYKASLHTYNDEMLTVTTMTRTPQGDLFVASCDSVFLVRNGQVENFSGQIPVIQSHEVRSLHFSPKGYLVVAAIDGLLIANTDNDYNVTQARWFDQTNGYTSLESLNAQMCEERDRRIWLAGIEEVTSFWPATLLSQQEDETIIIPPTPWWRQWWTIALYAAAFLFLGWWILHQYETRRIRRTLFRLQREIRQKELQIQAIRLKSFPHFHANVMAGIEYMMMNKSEETGKYMKIYSDFTNQTLSDIDNTSRSIAEEVEYTRLYLLLEQLRYGERLNYDIYVADNVNMQTQIPNMLIYTYTQNAVKHGISNKQEGGMIYVNVTRQSNRIIVSVSDNGVGREASRKQSRHSTKMGLRILLEQIELYNQANTEHIFQTVTDLHDAEGNATGTTFEMSIPIDYKYIIDPRKNK